MRELDAVNLILPKLGEHRVTRIDNRHPTVATIQPEMENQRKQLLLRGWWFNEFERTLYPDSEGFIALGSTYLSVHCTSELGIVRGDKLFNAEDYTYVWDAAVDTIIREDLDFALLPESAAQYILWSSAVVVFAQDLGVANELSLWREYASNAKSDLLAEHLRHVKHTTRNSRRFRRIDNARRG